MNILHMNTSDIDGGAARAAYRLHHGLLDIGVQSRILVQNYSTGEPAIIKRPSSWAEQLALWRPLLDTLPRYLHPNRRLIHWSTNWFPTRIDRDIQRLNPDIVHMHWINQGFVSIAALKNFNRPIVWTLHDCWPFTGGCHYPGACHAFEQGCGRCPMLASIFQPDLSRWTFSRKQRLWNNLNLTLVTPSQWMADMARGSQLFCDRHIEVIPNGLDTSLYRPRDRQTAREMFSLPKNRPLLLYGAMNALNDTKKGFSLLIEALTHLSHIAANTGVELVIFGVAKGMHLPSLSIPARIVGNLRDEFSMALLYSAADLTVVPSIEDNLPNIVMESMACGTPVVAFATGGIPDMITCGVNGLLASLGDTQKLASHLAELLNNEGRRNMLGEKARKEVERRFAHTSIAQRHVALYQSVLRQTQTKP
jgi:glycosyltransferase involved in cell wall biosynthesis